MRNGSNWWIVPTVVVCSFLGGIVGSRFWISPAYAQKPPKVQDVVASREFRLVDKDGKLRAELSLPYGEPILFFYDKTGKSRAWIALDQDGNPRIMFVDAKDQQVWKAP